MASAVDDLETNPTVEAGREVGALELVALVDGHLGILVADRAAMVPECGRRGFSEVRPNWYALPGGLVLAFLPME